MKPSVKINFETKPKIIFELPPILEAYCRFVFRTPAEQRQIVLTRRHDIGKLIFGHIMSADFSLKRPVMTHPVTFILPMPSNEHGYWLRYRHIYLPKWAEEKITDAIEYEFRSWVKERFRIGYDSEKYEQKTIVNAILRGLNVRNNAVNFDAIKKIDYRERRKQEEIQFMRLLNTEQSDI
jgi:hypothetical protein